MGSYASYLGVGDYDNVDQNDLDDVERMFYFFIKINKKKKNTKIIKKQLVL